MSNKLIKSTVIILGCSIIAKLSSFLWEAMMAAYFGASELSDAFYMTTSIFGILYPILDMGIWKVFLPIYKTKMVQESEERLHKIANVSVSFFFCLSVALVLFLIVMAKPLTWIIAPGFSPEKKAMTVQFLRWSSPTYLLMASTSVIAAMLQCHGRFLGSQLREIGTYIGRIPFVILCFRHLGIYAAVFALIAGSVFRLLIQLPFINWNWRFKPDFHFKDPDIRQMIRGLPSVALTSAINHINGLVDKIIASGDVNGAVTCLNYGNQLLHVFSGMISSAIATSTYPTIVQYIAEKKTDSLRELLSNIINVLSYFIVPISMFCVIFAEDIVTIAFQRGAFDQSAAILTGNIFAGYCIGMLFTGLSTIISNVFYGYGDTRFTMKISFLGIVLNIIFNLWFCRIWGVVGLAIATSLSAIICLLVKLVFVRKYIVLDYKCIALEVLKILMISGITVAGVFFLAKYLGNLYLRVFASLLCCIIVYLVLSYLFRLSAMSFALTLFRRKLGRK